MKIDSIGKKVDDIPVQISYRIIELFSAGLYSSPNKAFEELVSNSYDAFATKVAVYVPVDKSLDSSTMWVCDNGISMNQEGLKDLWKIGESKKGSVNSGERLPIGQFGIGKLATYILTYNLTYICKSPEGFYAVTMDYSKIDSNTEKLNLDEIKLSEEEAKQLITPYLKSGDQELVPFQLWGKEAEKSWTFTIMSNLKPKALEIKEGRLKWILSTALPLNPGFELYFNGDKISSSKSKDTPLKVWKFGQDDNIEKKYEEYSGGTDDLGPYVNFENLKKIRGTIELYRDSLVRGKSQDWGRSHGIFLLIRKRLVNLDDPLLGMNAMTHGVFNRIRIEIEADGLNEYITSTRESIKDSPALGDLKKYIQRKFTEIREYYFSTIEEEKKANRAAYKVAHAASSFSRRPLLVAARKIFSGDLSSLVLTTIPKELSDKDKQEIISGLENDLTSEEGIIKDVQMIAMRPEDPIANFNIISRTAGINIMHPFMANFIEDIKNPLPLQLFGLTEILTEASLVEQGVSEDNIKEIMHRRDGILRELTFSDKKSAPAVANLIKATLSDPDGLEEALTDSFSTLGYETTPIGGNGKPDGLASAYIGYKGSEENYSITYDAKSTSKERIMASTAHISGVDRHRRNYEADYAVVVAIDFQGADNPHSAVNDEAKNLKVSLIRASDLMMLVLLAGPKQVGLNDLRPLFENCHTVLETSEWINNLKNKTVNQGPIKEVLQVIHSAIKDDTEKPDVTAIRYRLKALNPSVDISSDEIIKLIQSIQIQVPNYISIENKLVSMNTPPEIILKALNQSSSDTIIPFEYRDLYIEAFGLKLKG